METDDRLAKLENRVLSFVTETQDRLKKIELMISSICSANAGILSENSEREIPVSSCGEEVQTSPTNEVEKPPLKLSISTIEELWFAKRPYPAFEVRVLEEGGQIHQGTDDWKLGIRLVSGSGEYLDHLLSTPTLTFPVQNGLATVKGLKFSAVSSRNGGFFRFELRLRHPSNVQIAPTYSCKIRVLSERLKHEVKANSVLELSPSDKLLRVPGIGKKYAKKLAERGFKTIADISSVMERDSPQTLRRRNLLIETVKDDKGGLTEIRLKDIMREAHAVVQREGETRAPTTPHHDQPPTQEASSPPSPDYGYDPRHNQVFSSSPVTFDQGSKSSECNQFFDFASSGGGSFLSHEHVIPDMFRNLTPEPETLEYS